MLKKIINSFYYLSDVVKSKHLHPKVESILIIENKVNVKYILNNHKKELQMELTLFNETYIPFLSREDVIRVTRAQVFYEVYLFQQKNENIKSYIMRSLGE